MLRPFLVLLIALPILVVVYGVVQWQTTECQRELRRLYEPMLRLYFSDSMQWLPYLAMLVGGGTSLIAYATNLFGGISVLGMVDVGIGSYAWYVRKGPCLQAQCELHLYGASEIGEIARRLADYNDKAYVHNRRSADWLKGIIPPASRLSADDDIDYALRAIWRLVAERYAADLWVIREQHIEQRRRLKDDAIFAIQEAKMAVERIGVIAVTYPGFGISLGLLDWGIPGLKPSAPTA